MTSVTTRELRLWLFAGSALCLALPAATLAQSTTSSDTKKADDQNSVEVVVTSERRSSTLQKTAASISVRGGNDMIEQGRTGLGAILEDVPGVSYSGSGETTDSTGLSVVIRGVQPSSTAGGSSSAPPTTAAYVDGVFNGIGGDYDLSRVEVLRGPQGTLYGRSATSGVVSVITNDPKLGVLGGDLLAETGTADYRHVSGDLNIGLGDKLALRIAGNDSIRNGYYSADGGYRKNTGVRAKLLYKPSADLKILVGASEQNQTINTGGTVFVADGPTSYTSSSGSVGSSKYQSRQYWAQIDWNLGWASLTYIPSYRDWSTGGVQVIGPDIIHQFNSYPRDNFVTHELRLTSTGNDRLTWLAGAFSYNNAYENQTKNVWWHSQALTWAQDVNKRTSNLGLFGEATYHFDDLTRLTVGARADTTKVDTFGYYTSNNAVPAAGATPFDTTWFLPEVLSTATLTRQAGERTFNNTTYKLRLERDLTPANTIYATVATGFVPGDTQFTTISGAATILPYNQETLTAYEIGSKNRYLQGRLTLNGDIYYYSYGGFQTTVNTSGNPQNPSYAILTAPATMIGVELEGRWLVTRADTLNFTYGHIDAKYRNVSAAFKTYVAEDKITALAPDTGSIRYEHGFAVGNSFLKAAIDARYTAGYELGSVTAAELGTTAQSYNYAKAAGLVDADLTWTSGQGGYSVTVYGRNLGDKRTRTSLLFQDDSITLSDPRTFGIVLQAHY